MKKILTLLCLCGLTTVNAADPEKGDPTSMAASPSQTLQTVKETAKEVEQEVKDTEKEIGDIIETSKKTVEEVIQIADEVEDDLAGCGCFGGSKKGKTASAKKGSAKKKK